MNCIKPAQDNVMTSFSKKSDVAPHPILRSADTLQTIQVSICAGGMVHFIPIKPINCLFKYLHKY